MHKLKYLPLALNDLMVISSYITHILNAPKAASDLIDNLDNSISRLQQFPYSCKVYQPMESLKLEYRMLPVKNYRVFYVATEHEVEIHRIIYAKMNLEKL
ncbi:MAG TPA: type II toxin-antitoxin system RelE/ParE family toxin [Desulfosporosinus sp.]|nr:type II toxin-antitoxin system RelE/ParE family toxin [Desulfosporosinus sp.]